MFRNDLTLNSAVSWWFAREEKWGHSRGWPFTSVRCTMHGCNWNDREMIVIFSALNLLLHVLTEVPLNAHTRFTATLSIFFGYNFTESYLNLRISLGNSFVLKCLTRIAAEIGRIMFASQLLCYFDLMIWYLLDCI